MKWDKKCSSCFHWHEDMCGAYREHPGGDCRGYIHKKDKEKKHELAQAIKEYAKRKRGY